MNEFRPTTQFFTGDNVTFMVVVAILMATVLIVIIFTTMVGRMRPTNARGSTRRSAK